MDVNSINEKLRTALHCAVASNQVEVVAELLKVPTINLNATDANGKTALHLSCYNSLAVKRVCYIPRAFGLNGISEDEKDEHQRASNV